MLKKESPKKLERTTRCTKQVIGKSRKRRTQFNTTHGGIETDTGRETSMCMGMQGMKRTLGRKPGRKRMGKIDTRTTAHTSTLTTHARINTASGKTMTRITDIRSSLTKVQRRHLERDPSRRSLRRQRRMERRSSRLWIDWDDADKWTAGTTTTKSRNGNRNLVWI